MPLLDVASSPGPGCPPQFGQGAWRIGAGEAELLTFGWAGSGFGATSNPVVLDKRGSLAPPGSAQHLGFVLGAIPSVQIV
jgi:hypothetical protein